MSLINLVYSSCTLCRHLIIKCVCVCILKDMFQDANALNCIHNCVLVHWYRGYSAEVTVIRCLRRKSCCVTTLTNISLLEAEVVDCLFFHFVSLFVRTTLINQLFCKCASVSLLANFELPLLSSGMYTVFLISVCFLCSGFC